MYRMGESDYKPLPDVLGQMHNSSTLRNFKKSNFKSFSKDLIGNSSICQRKFRSKEISPFLDEAKKISTRLIKSVKTENWFCVEKKKKQKNINFNNFQFTTRHNKKTDTQLRLYEEQYQNSQRKAFNEYLKTGESSEKTIQSNWVNIMLQKEGRGYRCQLKRKIQPEKNSQKLRLLKQEYEKDLEKYKYIEDMSLEYAQQQISTFQSVYTTTLRNEKSLKKQLNLHETNLEKYFERSASKRQLTIVSQMNLIRNNFQKELLYRIKKDIIEKNTKVANQEKLINSVKVNLQENINQYFFSLIKEGNYKQILKHLQQEPSLANIRDKVSKIISLILLLYTGHVEEEIFKLLKVYQHLMLIQMQKILKSRLLYKRLQITDTF